MEGGGEALSDHFAASPADPHRDAELPDDGAGAPGPGEHRQRAREPIAQPWRVAYVRLLGNLEIEVADIPTESLLDARPVHTRALVLSQVRGFGPLAKAACVALADEFVKPVNTRSNRTTGVPKAADLRSAVEPLLA